MSHNRILPNFIYYYSLRPISKGVYFGTQTVLMLHVVVVTQNENEHVRSIGKGEVRHRKY
jgi:hypothetical protein